LIIGLLLSVAVGFPEPAVHDLLHENVELFECVTRMGIRSDRSIPKMCCTQQILSRAVGNYNRSAVKNLQKFTGIPWTACTKSRPDQTGSKRDICRKKYVCFLKIVV
jgi:hypothetical protein